MSHLVKIAPNKPPDETLKQTNICLLFVNYANDGLSWPISFCKIYVMSVDFDKTIDWQY